MIVHLSTTDALKWTHEPLKDNLSRITEMKKSGKTQKDIAAELGLSEGRVSQIAKQGKRLEALV